MSFILLHREDMQFLTLADAKACIKYAKMAREIEKQILRKKRYAEYMKRKNGVS